MKKRKLIYEPVGGMIAVIAAFVILKLFIKTETTTSFLCSLPFALMAFEEVHDL